MRVGQNFKSDVLTLGQNFKSDVLTLGQNFRSDVLTLGHEILGDVPPSSRGGMVPDIIERDITQTLAPDNLLDSINFSGYCLFGL